MQDFISDRFYVGKVFVLIVTYCLIRMCTKCMQYNYKWNKVYLMACFRIICLKKDIFQKLWIQLML